MANNIHIELGISKIDFKNKIKIYKKNIKNFLIKNKISLHELKIEKAIQIFAEKHNFNIENYNKQQCFVWLFKYFIDPETFEILKNNVNIIRD